MAHKAYANLAHLEEFSRDLNYTGIPLEGWCEPVCLLPPVLLIITLITAGLPRGPMSYWALFNICLIHPMDFFVGALGIGPKYLLDEYAILDSRYWVTTDPLVTMVSAAELFIMAPLCYFWYRSLVQNRKDRPFFAVQACTWHLIGTIMYVGGEYLDGFKHLPGHDFVFPPKFDTYIKIKYFWIVFVFLNGIWVVLPTATIIKEYCREYCTCCACPGGGDKDTKKKD